MHNRAEGFLMGNVPLYEATAELFRTLGHPVRIRVLELLQVGALQENGGGA